jgi:hypothetical protein
MEVANFMSKSPTVDTKTNTKTKAIRWHFFLEPTLFENLQTQATIIKTEKFKEFVYDTNEHALYVKVIGYYSVFLMMIVRHGDLEM